MSQKHLQRPKLERAAPRRDWSTLFGVGSSTADGNARGRREPGGNPLSETVEMGYRVIDEYLKQGRQVAATMAPPGFIGKDASGQGPASTEEMQQMAQRVMQYGFDFAGMWFEMWTRMSGGAWPGMPNFFNGPPPFGVPPWPPPSAPPTPSASSSATMSPSPPPQSSSQSGFDGGSAHRSGENESVTVSVESENPTTASVQLRPGRGPLSIHKLRPEHGEGPAIAEVALESSANGLQVTVRVPPDQQPGRYRAAIVDESNHARGTLLVTVQPRRE